MLLQTQQVSWRFLAARLALCNGCCTGALQYLAVAGGKSSTHLYCVEGWAVSRAQLSCVSLPVKLPHHFKHLTKAAVPCVQAALTWRCLGCLHPRCSCQTPLASTPFHVCCP